MKEKEKDILEAVGKAIPQMSDMEKGYFLGFAEALTSCKKDDKQRDESEPLEGGR